MWPPPSMPRVTSMLRWAPSRSSRSRPASRTSWRDPTGPASLAIAIGRTLTIAPVVGVGDLSQVGAGRVVAERADEAGLVGGARRMAELRGGLVVACQIGLEHRRVVGRDRAADTGRDELRQRVLLERRDGSGAEVRKRADVEDDAAICELGDEA